MANKNEPTQNQAKQTRNQNPRQQQQNRNQQGSDRRGGGRDRRRGPQQRQDEFAERIVAINRVSKTVKGGRLFKFVALVVVGDGEGKVGFGMGKAGEVPDAIRKGIDSAKKNMIQVPITDGTIPHEIIGEFGAARVLMKPAVEGTGVIAGGPVRAVVESAGIRDIRTKALRSNNPVNVVKATLDGLTRMRTVEQVAAIRGKSPEEILG